MDERPKCIIVSGRPGSGKTTLANELSRRLYLPRVSRDEIKEGYVSTLGVGSDQLPEDTNGKVNEIFFAIAVDLARSGVSLVLEAAFQHQVWSLVVPRLQQVAELFILICDLDGETSVQRHVQRGLKDGNREFFHGDRAVSLFRETGKYPPVEPHDPPHFEVPTLLISTLDGYAPGIEEIIEFSGGLANKTPGSDV